MQWKEALFIKNKEEKINLEVYEALLLLPEIITSVFMPDYVQYGYKVTEPIYDEFVVAQNTVSVLKTFLLSTKANRTINLSYIFANDNHKLGILNDSISLADATKGWGIKIYLQLLANNRGLKLSNEKYNIADIYEGVAFEKLYTCVKQVKFNYDTIALDIISGDNWDSNAWDIGKYF